VIIWNYCRPEILRAGGETPTVGARWEGTIKNIHSSNKCEVKLEENINRLNHVKIVSILLSVILKLTTSVALVRE
jgi:hypothetical protein